MKRLLPLLWLLVIATVPLWLRDQYFLHVTITTAIFIIAAMSLNLLLGYTGQLSLGHVAFFGIGAYASALTTLGFNVELPGDFTVVHTPWPAVAGFFMAVMVAGLSGYAIGKLSFKVRGAYFVIVTISFAEVTRLVALNWVELTQGPLALTNIPPYTLWIPGIGEYEFWNKTAYYYLVAVSRPPGIRDHQAPGEFPHRPRHGRLEGERIRLPVRSGSTSRATSSWRRWYRRPWRARREACTRTM